MNNQQPNKLLSSPQTIGLSAPSTKPLRSSPTSPRLSPRLGLAPSPRLRSPSPCNRPLMSPGVNRPGSRPVSRQESRPGSRPLSPRMMLSSNECLDMCARADGSSLHLYHDEESGQGGSLSNNT
jgi:hypothetical protein